MAKTLRNISRSFTSNELSDSDASFNSILWDYGATPSSGYVKLPKFTLYEPTDI